MNVGKGANAIIISMLHHFFQVYGLGETVVHLHADNCSGQNKNQYMMQYLAWRVLSQKHKITLSFLPVGHTKFSRMPDLGCLSGSGCLEDIVQVVGSSASMNHCQLVGKEMF